MIFHNRFFEFSPVPKCEGPGAPSMWLEQNPETGATRQVMTSPARIPVARFDARHFLRSIRSTNVRGDFANIEVREILVQGYRQGRQCG